MQDNGSPTLQSAEDPAKADLVRRLLGLAHTMAETYAQNYKGKPHTQHLTYDDFMEAAHLKITEALLDRDQPRQNNEVDAVDRRALAFAMNDWVREVKGRKGQRTQERGRWSAPVPLSRVSREELDVVLARDDGDPARQPMNLTGGEPTEILLEKLGSMGLLGEKEYLAFSSMARLRPLGLSNQEIADQVGMFKATFDSHLTHAKDKIRNNPAIREMAEDILGGNFMNTKQLAR